MGQNYRVSFVHFVCEEFWIIFFIDVSTAEKEGKDAGAVVS